MATLFLNFVKIKVESNIHTVYSTYEISFRISEVRRPGKYRGV